MNYLEVIRAAEALAATPAARPNKEEIRLHNAFALGRYIEDRRRELNLLIQRAAELAGIEFSEWCALEAGHWVPSDENLISAISQVLEVTRSQIAIMAMIARANQRHC